MKKALLVVPVVALMTACSSMKTVETRKSYAEPKWYSTCVQSGKEGWFWASTDVVYSCGAGESRFAQAAEEQMYAIAMNNFAKRIKSQVNSSTEIKFVDDKKSTKTVISYSVNDTVIREHLMKETGHFTMAGKHYTFVRLKMPKEVFDQLTVEAKQ
jgi:hypothetical protein